MQDHPYEKLMKLIREIRMQEHIGSEENTLDKANDERMSVTIEQ